MKEREFDLENGNSDELYSELSRQLGVQIPQNHGYPSQPEPSHYSHGHRNGGGLSIVTQPSPALNGSASQMYGYGQSYHNAHGHDYHLPGGPIYGHQRNPSNNPLGDHTHSNNSSVHRGQELYNEKYYDDHHDGQSLRNRRPDQLQQRDLDQAKAERMLKRQKSKKLPKKDEDEESQFPSYWVIFSRVVTCCFPSPLLALMGEY
jgi:hypothetical protein